MDEERLDRAFTALGDPVRRAIMARLSTGPLTVNDLAEPFAMSKQAVSKHIQVLEQADLVTRSRDAQRRPVHLNPTALKELTAWIDHYRLVHERRFRSLDALLDRIPERLTASTLHQNQERTPAMSTSRTTNALTVAAPEGAAVHRLPA